MTALAATFVSCSTVAGRKQARLVFELPIEKLSEALTILGSPDPAGDTWCGIARLVSEPKPEKVKDADKSERAKAEYASRSEMEKAVVRASLLCKDRAFQDYMHAGNEEEVTEYLRLFIGHKSRAAIGHDGDAYKKFLALETEYRMASGQMAEAR